MDNKVLSSELQKIYYDQHRKEDEFKLGDLVLYKSRKLSDAFSGFSEKLAPNWEGPYVVIDKQNQWTYILGNFQQEPITYAHVGNMKLYAPREAVDTQLNADKIKDKLTTFKSSVGIAKRRGRKKK